MSERSVGIFVATVTGTAELCAEEIEIVLTEAGLAVECRLMDDLTADSVVAHEFIVIISSTYGQGDIPDNGQALYDALSGIESLEGRRFAVFGLGDRTYAATFCNAGQKWDALFSAKGASRFSPLMQHDASAGTLAEDVAGAWASELVIQLKEVV